MTAFGEFLREDVACYGAQKQSFVFPKGQGNDTGAWRKVFLLWRIRAPRVTPFYPDHVFQDLHTGRGYILGVLEVTTTEDESGGRHGAARDSSHRGICGGQPGGSPVFLPDLQSQEPATV